MPVHKELGLELRSEEGARTLKLNNFVSLESNYNLPNFQKIFFVCVCARRGVFIPFKWKAALRMYDWIHSVSSDDWSPTEAQILLHKNAWDRKKERRYKRRRR